MRKARISNKRAGRFICLAVALCVLLSGCTFRRDTNPPVQTQTVNYPIAESDEDDCREELSVEEVLDLMRYSFETWDSVVIEFRIVERHPEQDIELPVYRNAFWVDAGGRARIEYGVEGQDPEYIWIRDATRSCEWQTGAAGFDCQNFPGTFVFEAEMARDMLAMGHPLGRSMPSALRENIFPEALLESITPRELEENVIQELQIQPYMEGLDDVAGQRTIRMERIIRAMAGSGEIHKYHQYWVDARTGLILRLLYLDPETGAWRRKYEAVEVMYDQALPEELMDLDRLISSE